MSETGSIIISILWTVSLAANVEATYRFLLLSAMSFDVTDYLVYAEKLFIMWESVLNTWEYSYLFGFFPIFHQPRAGALRIQVFFVGSVKESIEILVTENATYCTIFLWVAPRESEIQ